MSERPAERSRAAPMHLLDAEPPGSGSRTLLDEIIERWRNGEPPDARTALDEYPRLHDNKSVVMDLAYEEYCLRREAGEPVDADAFCACFPDYRSSLRRVIAVNRFLDAHPELLPGQAPAAWPQPGHEFLGFQLRRELGRGSFARVFLATQPAVGDRPVAVKVAYRGGAEAKTLGRLRHPGIVQVLSIQEDDSTGLTVVCMPYLGKTTLADVIDRAFARLGLPQEARVILEATRTDAADEFPNESAEPPPILETGSYVDGVVHLGARMAEALEYTHARGVLHRDLKPSNVLITPDGQPMLLDFNLSSDPQLPHDILGGTLPYMSPEHLLASDPERQGGPAVLDARSDVFALGVILYELLTGNLPFGPMPIEPPAEGIRDHLLARQRQGPQPIRTVNPRVEPRLARVIESCLAYDPAARPVSAAALAADLGLHFSPARRLKRWLRRHLLASALTAAAALGACGLLAFHIANRPAAELRRLEDGWRAFDNRAYPEAVESFTEALQADPNLAEAWYARGRAHVKLGQYPLAVSDLMQAQSLQPSSRTKACLGYCFARTGEHSAAIQLLTEAIDEGFVNAEVYNDVAYAEIQRGRHPAAAESLSRSLALDARLPAALENQRIYEFLRENPDASPDLVPDGLGTRVDRLVDPLRESDR